MLTQQSAVLKQHKTVLSHRKDKKWINGKRFLLFWEWKKQKNVKKNIYLTATKSTKEKTKQNYILRWIIGRQVEIFCGDNCHAVGGQPQLPEVQTLLRQGGQCPQTVWEDNVRLCFGR